MKSKNGKIIEEKKKSSTLIVYPEQKSNGLGFNVEIPWICKAK